jgi:NAD(P)-dependent dehydrogenase (short-subunit alcohol dehydrogenase family)
MLDRNELFDLSGKTALVTGASSGLGVTFARALLANGASVVICARREERLAKVANELDPTGERVLALRCDVGDAEQVQAVADAAVKRFGRIDILVNNAGIEAEGSPFAERIADDDFAETVRVNLLGVWHCTRIVGTQMIEQGDGGSIINISSIGGLGGSKGMMSPGYSATKAAVINLTQNVAANWGDRGVRVNCIAPGYFPSEMSEFVRNNPPVTEHVWAQIPVGRFGDPEELVGTLLLLASDAGSYMTGQTIAVDGGFSATVGARTPSTELYDVWESWLPGDKGRPINPVTL